MTRGDFSEKIKHKSALTLLAPPISAEGQKMKMPCLDFKGNKGAIILPSNTKGAASKASIFFFHMDCSYVILNDNIVLAEMKGNDCQKGFLIPE